MHIKQYLRRYIVKLITLITAIALISSNSLASTTSIDNEIKTLQARIKELRAEKKKSKLKIQIEKAMKKLAELKDKENKI